MSFTDPLFDHQLMRENWPEMRIKIAQLIEQMVHDQLQKAIGIPDACMSWVVPLQKVGKARHMAERGMLLNDGHAIELAVAPQFTNAKERMIEPQN